MLQREIIKNPKKLHKEKFEELNSFEAKQNLVGFFNLLLQIDRRNHPEKYKNNDGSKKINDRYNNPTDSNR